MQNPSVLVSLCLEKISGGSWLLHWIEYDSSKNCNETTYFSAIITVSKKFFFFFWKKKVSATSPVRKKKGLHLLICSRILARKEVVIICTILLVQTPRYRCFHGNFGYITVLILAKSWDYFEKLSEIYRKYLSFFIYVQCYCYFYVLNK